jgi:rhodanese-related sulfurtransferase
MPITIQTISKDELQAKLNAGEKFQLINALEPEHYDLGSIKGSILLPLSQLNTRVGELDLSQEVVVYCASEACPVSRQAAEKLADAGFNVRAYEGGVKEWKAAGLPMEV